VLVDFIGFLLTLDWLEENKAAQRRRDEEEERRAQEEYDQQDPSWLGEEDV
jgi:hypothetical protein